MRSSFFQSSPMCGEPRVGDPTVRMAATMVVFVGLRRLLKAKAESVIRRGRSLVNAVSAFGSIRSVRPMGEALSIGLLVLGLAACGDEEERPTPGATPTASRTATLTSSVTAPPSATATATPSVTAAPSATTTPSPTLLIRYRLTAGSQILFSPPSPVEAPTVVEPLSGTFTVVRAQPRPLNTIFAFTITGIDFHGGSQFIVTDGNPMPIGCALETSLGCIQALTFEYPRRVHMFARVSVNGQEVGLNGSGSLDDENDPPTIENLEACGVGIDRSVDCEAVYGGTETGYVLTIFAVPGD